MAMDPKPKQKKTPDKWEESARKAMDGIKKKGLPKLPKPKPKGGGRPQMPPLPGKGGKPTPSPLPMYPIAPNKPVPPRGKLPLKPLPLTPGNERKPKPLPLAPGNKKKPTPYGSPSLTGRRKLK